MKKILFAVSALALTLSVGPVSATDLPSRKQAPIWVPPPPPPLPLWTGFYGGLNIGGGWDDGGGSTGYSAYYDPNFAIGSSPTYFTGRGRNRTK
ncbi:MAG: porin family protein, partial [Methylocystis sp.]